MYDLNDVTAPSTHPAHPVGKATLAWGGVGIAELLQAVGITTWGEAAAAAAFLYSTILIMEWAYKRVLCPIIISRKSKDGGD